MLKSVSMLFRPLPPASSHIFVYTDTLCLSTLIPTRVNLSLSCFVEDKAAATEMEKQLVNKGATH